MFSLLVRGLFTMCILGTVSASPVFAQDANVDELLNEVDKRLKNQNIKQSAIEAGRQRAVLCQSCHGKDGNSTQPGVPNLAGQNAGYLLQQINLFANGQRKDFVMNQLAENFSAEDKINIAIFYNSMQVKPPHVNWHLAKKGENLYKDKCKSCHGDEGLGNKKLARLAGQQADYVITALTNFRNAANNTSNNSSISSPSLTVRSSPTMEKITKNLSDREIEELAHYVAQLSFDDYYDQ